MEHFNCIYFHCLLVTFVAFSNRTKKSDLLKYLGKKRGGEGGEENGLLGEHRFYVIKS